MELNFASIAMIFLSAAITQNILLSQFLGMCSFIAVSRSMKTAVGLGLAVVFVSVCTSVINYLVYMHILTPMGLTSFGVLIFIMIIAGFVQLVEMIIERFSPVLYINLGIYLPLITVNCAILGISITMVQKGESFGLLQAIVYALGSGLGWMLSICLMAGIRQRLEHADIPKPLQGLGITMMITGLMALAFMGFAGVGGGH